MIEININTQEKVKVTETDLSVNLASLAFTIYASQGYPNGETHEGFSLWVNNQRAIFDSFAKGSLRYK